MLRLLSVYLDTHLSCGAREVGVVDVLTVAMG